MDIMRAVTREQVDVRIATTQSYWPVCHGAVNQFNCQADECMMLVHYRMVNLAMVYANCYNEAVTKLGNH